MNIFQQVTPWPCVSHSKISPFIWARRQPCSLLYSCSFTSPRGTDNSLLSHKAQHCPLWSSFLQECSWARGRSTAETWDSTNQFCALPLPPLLHRPQNLSFEIPLEKMREKERHKGTAFTWCEWHRGCSLQLSKTPVASILQQVSNLRPACPPRRPRMRIPCQGPGASRALRCFVVPTSLAGRGKAHTGGRIPAGSFATR